jgi:NAD(P)-dependent dehydrogenase (short-subunit alcohol dehydrogenase family)
MAATHPLEHVYAYACAKAAVDCLVRYAAIEYGPRGIRVNSILPGAIRSEMSSALWAVEGMEQSWAGECPLGRIGMPADFADAALWLAGDAFVTGLNLQVSGGNQLTRFPRLHERPALAVVDPTSGV